MRILILLVLGTASLWSIDVCLYAQESADGDSNVGRLVEALKGDGEDARRAVDALVQIGPVAVPALVEALRDKDARVELVVHALAQIGPASVVALKEALRDEDVRVAELAAYVLGQIGPAAVPALREALNDDVAVVRIRAAWALGRIGPAAEAAVYDLGKAVKEEHRGLRNSAAEALGNIGAAAKSAIPALLGVLEGKSGNGGEAAAEALAKVSESLGAEAVDLSTVERREIASSLTYVARELESVGMDAERIHAVIEVLTPAPPAPPVAPANTKASIQAEPPAESLPRSHAPPQAQRHRLPATAFEYFNEKRWPWAVVGYCVLFLFWTMVLLVWPGGIHATNEFLRRLPEAKIKIPVEMTLSLRHVLLVGFFQYHCRVLDAWVQGCLATARQNFGEIPTVKDREIHVTLPVRLDGLTHSDLSSETLCSVFGERQPCLLISGEGGSGKTSLACHVARWAMGTEPDERILPHAMLPVLIEDELGQKGLIEEAQAKLQELVGQSHRISLEFFCQLLRKKRVLLIVDHLSEMSDVTRQHVWGVKADSSVGALVVTSRIEEPELGATAALQTLPLKEDQVATFVRAYLAERKHADRFPDDEEYFDFCHHLARLGGDRDITVLVAQSYLDQLAASKDDSPPTSMLDNVPDLMLRHLNGLHPAGTKPDTMQVARQDAVQSAWQCVNKTHRPETVDRQELLTALGGEDADSRLKYLRETLQILRSEAHTADRLRFVSSPFAEYLAGFYMVERCGEAPDCWTSFLSRLDERPVEKTKGFLLAVRDCCLSSRIVPDSVTDEMARRGGLDMERVERHRHRQRIRGLIADLKLPNPKDRRHAAETLAEIGPGAVAAVPTLTESLKDWQLDVREAAACALGTIGSSADAAISALAGALKDEDERVRIAAAGAVRRIGPGAEAAVPSVIEALRDEDERVRSAAAEAVGGIGSGAEAAVLALVESLEDEDKHVVLNAAQALGTIGPGAEAAAPALAGALKDESSPVRLAAARAVGEIGPPAEGAAAALVEALKDEGKDVRHAAEEALRKIGRTAAPALIDALTDEDEHVVLIAAEALGAIGPDASSAVPSLTEAVEDGSPPVREIAANALGEIGPAAEAAGPTLVMRLRDDVESVRFAAGEALRRMEAAAAPALIQVLRDEEEPRRKHDASMVLAGIGSAAVPALGDALAEGQEDVRVYASLALKEVGREAVAALPALIEALKDEADRVRLNAAWALQGMGREATAALPALIEASTDENGGVRHNAVLALGKIGPEAEAAVPALIEALKDSNDGVRHNAVIALGEIDREAKATMPALIEALKDEDEDVRRAAADVLARSDSPQSSRS